MRRRIGDSAAAFRSVFANPGLRKLELAWAASILGNWAFLIAVSVYAFDVGGEAAVGLILLLRMIPAALIAPFAGLVADRYGRERVLLTVNIVRVVLIGTAAVCVAADAAPSIVYALAVATSIATTPFRSAQAALTPALARSPSELTAANAVASTIESLAAFIGPTIAGLLLVVTTTSVVFAITAGLVAVSAVFVLGIRVAEQRGSRGLQASTIASELMVGFRTVLSQPALRVLVGMFAAQSFVAGAAQIYLVVYAFDILDLGDGGVGYLNAAIGVGALVGGVLTLLLTGAKRLSPTFLLGIVLWGAPLVVLGASPALAAVLLLFALIGLGNSLVDVAGFTLVQRSVPDEVLARVFGVIQMLWLGSVGIGAFVAPALISWLGFETALVVTGIALPLLVLLLGKTLVGIDAAAKAPEAEELRVLGAVPIFAPLPGASLEHLAGRLVPLRIDDGAVVVREGDEGDRFYMVAEGELEVSQDGAVISTLETGDYFGEIALIRDMPRTATVTARGPAVLYALDREDFLAAVTGHPQSAEAAESVVGSRLLGPAATGYRTSVN